MARPGAAAYRTCGNATPRLIRCARTVQRRAPPRTVVRSVRDERAAKRSGAGRRRVDGAIGAVPSTVAPGQVPARAIRHRCRYEVEPGGSEGVTATEPRQRHPAAYPQTKTADRLIGVIRAGRQMPAVEPDHRRNGVAVDLDQSARGKRGAAGKIAQQPAHALSLAHPRFHHEIHRNLIFLPPRDNCGSRGGHAVCVKIGRSEARLGLDPNLRRL
jgi:hypothetical protein